MPATAPHPSRVRNRLLAGVAVIFGLLTLIAGGSVLFGPDMARSAAGAYVPFVVWFNFLAGFAYVIAGLGLWTGTTWARMLAGLIAVATVLAALAFAVHVARGGVFEMRTVLALIFRAGIWALIAFLTGRASRAS